MDLLCGGVFAGQPVFFPYHRLSDITLDWMLKCASTIPSGILYDPRVLKLSPSPDGWQHDEAKAGLGLLTTLTGCSWTKGERILRETESEPLSNAAMHPSFTGALTAERCRSTTNGNRIVSIPCALMSISRGITRKARSFPRTRGNTRRRGPRFRKTRLRGTRRLLRHVLRYAYVLLWTRPNGDAEECR
jgi:hypothetical protein